MERKEQENENLTIFHSLAFHSGFLLCPIAGAGWIIHTKHWTAGGPEVAY
jgi:hypothetical protein